MKKLFSLAFSLFVVGFAIFVPQGRAQACSNVDGLLALPGSLGAISPGQKVKVQFTFVWKINSPFDCGDVDLTTYFYANVNTLDSDHGRLGSGPNYVGSVNIGKLSNAVKSPKTFSVDFDADKLISIAKTSNIYGDGKGALTAAVATTGTFSDTWYTSPVTAANFQYTTDRDVWACVNKDRVYTCYTAPQGQDQTGTKDLCERFTNGCRADQSPLVSCAIIDRNKCNTTAPLNTNSPPPGPTTTVGTTGQDISVNLDIRNPLAISDVNQLISKIQEWLIKFSIPVGVILIIYAGILMIFSRGNSAQITKARQIIQGVALGLAIIFIGSGFVSLVESILELGGPTSTPGPTATLDPNDGTCLCEPGAGVCLSQQCKSGTYCFAINGTGQCKAPAQDPYEGDDCSVNACPGGYTCSSFKFCHRILP